MTVDGGHSTGWFRRLLHWLFGRRPCFGGLTGALVFFCLSLAPSLLPRGVILQGIVSGVTAVIGYGFGSAASAGIRTVEEEEPSSRVKHIAWWVLLGVTVVFVPIFLALGRAWQDDVRGLMGMEDLAAYDWALILVVTVIVAL